MTGEEWVKFQTHFAKAAEVIQILREFSFTIGLGGTWRFPGYNVMCICSHDGKVKWARDEVGRLEYISAEEAFESLPVEIRRGLLFHLDILS